MNHHAFVARVQPVLEVFFWIVSDFPNSQLVHCWACPGELAGRTAALRTPYLARGTKRNANCYGDNGCDCCRL